jgi:2,3-bisphosphoglycerate-independent phosphoglycerate mutase
MTTKDQSKIKFVLLVGDGMGDYGLPELGGKTPLDVAKTPNMDRIAACRIGLVKTIPDDMEPGSDVANLSLLGYDARIYHNGRAPFEAASMGVSLGQDEVAFRMNLVTLERKSEDKIIMISHSSGDISTEEGRQIVEGLKGQLTIPAIRIYPGVAYRHLLVWDGGPLEAETIPPHDVLDQNMAPYLNNTTQNPITGLIRQSWQYLEKHPVNIARGEKGREMANSIWLWGQGKAPNLPLFGDKFGLQGGIISAVDLLKGIGIYAGMEAIEVEGATGYLDTNYRGKAEEALKCLERLDFVFVHVEAPDEASHNGNIEEKIQAIEAFDKKVVGTVLKGMAVFEDYRILVASDHLTPISKKTHVNDPTPFAWASKKELTTPTKAPGFTEQFAEESGLAFQKGHDLMPAFLSTP